MTVSGLRLAALLVLLASLSVVPASAQFSLTLRAGTFGPGAELTANIGERLALRAGGTFLPYSRQDLIEDEVDVMVDSEVQVASGSLIADWYPFKKVMRLSGGVYYNAFNAKARITPMSSYTIDNKEFAPERLGWLSANLDYGSKINPYAGLGFGHPGKGWRIQPMLDIGILYTDSPRLNLEGDGMIGPTQNHEGSFNEGLSEFQFYPVVSFGLGVRL